MSPASIARRLANLEGVSLSQEDLESIIREFEDYDRALAELRVFADAVDWQLAFPDRPSSPPTRADHA